MIDIIGVSKHFGTVEAIGDLSLTIGRGEFFSLLGASGSGKTTLLRMIAGFENVSRGEISIDGVSMSDVPPHRRPINMVFQNYAIFPHFNVRDNIAYGLRRSGLSRAQRAARVDEMLDLIALPGFGDRRATQLSGGQMQRVALARALILEPKVLLLDEPLGALDKQLREQMQLELRSLQRKLGITFVLVTHDQEEALTLSDRIAVMAKGRILQIDTPTGLYDRPRNREIARFIGNMNFFDAVVDKSGGAPRIDVRGLGRMPLNGQGDGRGDGTAQVAVRPETFSLHRTDPAAGIPAVAVVMLDRQYLGGRLMIYVRLPDRDSPVAIACPRVVGGEDWDIEPGTPVWLSCNPDAIILLEDG